MQSNIYRRVALASAVALVGSIGVASASNVTVTTGTDDMGRQTVKREITLDNPSQWANIPANKVPTVGDPSTGTNRDYSPCNSGCSSWVSTGGRNQRNYLRFQGNLDSQSPAAADPNSADSPKLLFDPGELAPQDQARGGLLVSDITRVAWDTQRTQGTGAENHWFLNLVTKASDGEPSHTLRYGLVDENGNPDDTGYVNGQWNTQQVAEGPAQVENAADGLQLRLYDPTASGGDAHHPTVAKTLDEWTATEGDNEQLGANEPIWWGQHVNYLALATATGSGNAFTSNIDNFQFQYDTSHSWGKSFVDLQAPPESVPEPSNILLMGLGLGMILMLVRRRQKMA